MPAEKGPEDLGTRHDSEAHGDEQLRTPSGKTGRRLEACAFERGSQRSRSIRQSRVRTRARPSRARTTKHARAERDDGPGRCDGETVCRRANGGSRMRDTRRGGGGPPPTFGSNGNGRAAAQREGERSESRPGEVRRGRGGPTTPQCCLYRGVKDVQQSLQTRGRLCRRSRERGRS